VGVEDGAMPFHVDESDELHEVMREEHRSRRLVLSGQHGAQAATGVRTSS
jgi:hypothetical protein